MVTSPSNGKWLAVWVRISKNQPEVKYRDRTISQNGSLLQIRPSDASAALNNWVTECPNIWSISPDASGSTLQTGDAAGLKGTVSTLTA